MLNTTSHQKNVNQTIIRYHFIPIRMATIKKKKNSENNKCWWRCGEIETHAHCGGDCKMMQPLCITDCFLKKLKSELPYDPLIPLLGIYPKGLKAEVWRDAYTPMFTVALVTVSRVGKQPNVYQQIHRHTKCGKYVYYWNIIQPWQGRKPWHTAQHGSHPADSVLSETGQS